MPPLTLLSGSDGGGGGATEGIIICLGLGGLLEGPVPYIDDADFADLKVP